MKFDFSIPQRQSKLGILVLFVFTLQKIIRISIAMIVVFAMNMDMFFGKLIWLGISIFVVSVFVTFIRYYYFTFQIDYKSKELIIQKGFLKKWLKMFWLPTFPQISKLILSSDVVIFTIIVGSIGEVAYWFVAMTIAATVLHSTNISNATNI